MHLPVDAALKLVQRCSVVMTLAIAPTDRADDGDALTPLMLPESLQLTVEQFAAVCRANPNAVLELDAKQAHTTAPCRSCWEWPFVHLAFP